MTNGVYVEDDCSGLSVDLIEQFYGVTADLPQRHAGQSGAGHPPEENSDVADEENEPAGSVEDNSCMDELAQTQDENVRHDAIPVAEHRSPFDLTQEAFFDALLDAAFSGHVIPDGYGLSDGELASEPWNQFQDIGVGRKRASHLCVELPVAVWLPRARQWVQALEIMNHLVFSGEN